MVEEVSARKARPLSRAKVVFLTIFFACLASCATSPAADPSTTPAPPEEPTTAVYPSTTGPLDNRGGDHEPQTPTATRPVTETSTPHGASEASTTDVAPATTSTSVAHLVQETTQPVSVDPTTTTHAELDEHVAEPVPLLEPIVVNAHDHDPDAFTQGLVFRDGYFYESTGLYGGSSVRIVDPVNGEVLLSRSLDNDYFGEGLEVVGNRVVQLTWKAGIAFIWDARTLEPLGTYTYGGEGWGLCAFEDRFVMSDGSSTLTFRHVDTFAVVGEVEVLLEGEPVHNLNELECVEDIVYANVWFSDEILVISPLTGQVVTRIDGSALRQHLTSTEGIDVLNGIAYNRDRRTLYLTGKLWPEVFEVRVTADR